MYFYFRDSFDQLIFFLIVSYTFDSVYLCTDSQPQASNDWKGFFSISSYTQYFNVDTDIVLNRLISSLYPIGGDFTSKIDANPDLWVSVSSLNLNNFSLCFSDGYGIIYELLNACLLMSFSFQLFMSLPDHLVICMMLILFLKLNGF